MRDLHVVGDWNTHMHVRFVEAAAAVVDEDWGFAGEYIVGVEVGDGEVVDGGLLCVGVGTGDLDEVSVGGLEPLAVA